MAELATIARPYAQALFKAATDSGAASDLQAIAGWLDALAALAAAPELRQLADNPRVTPEQVFAVFSAAVRPALPELGQNFLRTVLANARLAALPQVALQFRARINEHRGVSDAVVYSAFPMDDAALAALRAPLEKRFARKLQLTVQVDRALIGGICVAVGDQVLDTSVRARLEQMKAALTA